MVQDRFHLRLEQCQKASEFGNVMKNLLDTTKLKGRRVNCPQMEILKKITSSVIFCEAIAIYGVIVEIILQTKLESVPASQIYAPESLIAGYAIFASGIIESLWALRILSAGRSLTYTMRA